MRIERRAVALFLALAACGGADPSRVPDSFRGFIDGSVLDAKLLPGKCDNKPCYAGQPAFAHGASIFFFNLGTVVTSTFPVQKAASAPQVFTMSDCDAVAGFDPMHDAYASASQFPLFSSLPLATKQFGVVVLPFVTVTSATHSAPFSCNAVKDAASVSADPMKPGKFGLTPATSGEVRLWAVVDPTAPVNPSTPDDKLGTSLGWYKTLLLAYLDGGPVPVNDAGELVAMDAVILDPAGVTTFAKPTDPRVVLLPFIRGEPGFSPIVRLHSFRFPAGKGPGDYTGICLTGMNCGANEVNFTQAAASAFNTIFIAQ